MKKVVSMQIPRPDYLDKLLRKRGNGRVKIITGIRRCGKSYLLFNLFKEFLLANGVAPDQVIELALDDLANIRYRNPFELVKFVRSKIRNPALPHYVFIDEIQCSREEKNPYVSGDQRITFVDALVSLMRTPNLDIYVTGSNSRMLSSDILTQFGDRGDEVRVFPLSFAEYRGACPEKASARRDDMVLGGMPHVLSLPTLEEKSLYLKRLFEETYVRDILERNHLRNSAETLGLLIDFVSSAVGSLTNPTTLQRRFDTQRRIRISHATISQYLDYLEEAFLLSSAKRYDVKGSRYFSSQQKYYFTDIGLRNARINFRQTEPNHIMENVLYNDLVRRGFNVDVGVVPIQRSVPGAGGRRENIQLEVDFVVNRGMDRCYIQSAFSIPDEAKQEQETASLNRIRDSFQKIVVLRENVVPWTDERGIRYVGLEDFLLGEKVPSF